MGDDGQIVAEFALELGHFAHVIHAFVESAAELGRDGLQGNLRVAQRGQNNQQFGRRLRRVGLVHRNFGGEISRAFGAHDALINAARRLDGGQIFGGNLFDLGARSLKRRVNVGRWKFRRLIRDGD